MRPALLALVLIATAGTSRAAGLDPASPIPDARSRPLHYLFAGIPWGTPLDSVQALLSARGYAEVAGSRLENRLHFTGTLFEHWATVNGSFDDRRRLARWEITIPSKGEREAYVIQRGIYDDVVKEMESKYGRRRTVSDRFRFPFRKGDGSEDKALRDDMATIRSVWQSRAGDVLKVELDRNVNLIVAYEGAAWRAAESRLRRKKAKDL